MLHNELRKRRTAALTAEKGLLNLPWLTSNFCQNKVSFAAQRVFMFLQQLLFVFSFHFSKKGEDRSYDRINV
jgi:hypothetical protein